MTESINDVRDTLREFRSKSLTNAYEQIQTATSLYEDDNVKEACFLAMTAIEEAGKVPALQFVDIFSLHSSISKIDSSNLQHFLRSHPKKSLRAASYALCVNHGAARRHGQHPEAEIPLKYGVMILARAGNQWMRVRGNCLYTDCNLSAKSVASPNEMINKHYAYYFICMGYEVVAESAEAGFGSFLEGRRTEPSHEFWRSTLKELEEFMDRHESDFEPTSLEFFTMPQLESHVDEIKSSLFEKNEIQEHISEIVDENKEDGEYLEEMINGEGPEHISTVCMEEWEELMKLVRAILATEDE